MSNDLPVAQSHIIWLLEVSMPSNPKEVCFQQNPLAVI